MKDAKALEAYKHDELDDDMAPLSGTTEDRLIAEIRSAPSRLDLAATMPALVKRPLALLYAPLGNGR